jgi:hypothetical protein
VIIKGVGADLIQTIYESTNGTSWTARAIGTTTTSDAVKNRLWARAPAVGVSSNFIGVRSSMPGYATGHSSVIVIVSGTSVTTSNSYAPTPRTADLPSAQSWYLTKSRTDSVAIIDLPAKNTAKPLSSPTLYIGRSEDAGSRWNISSETVSFNIGEGKFDTIIAGFDRTAFNVTLTAYRGVDGSVTLNTIDPNPDVEYQVSSVTINRGARSLDEVGMLDSFFMTYAVGRILPDSILIGSYQDQRQRAEERISFAITKALADSTTMLDLSNVFDGITYASTILKTEQLTAGFGSSAVAGVKSSGSNLERIPFQVNLTAKQGANWTVSGVTVAASALGERLFVGQQYTGAYRANDGQERIQIQPGLGKFETIISGNNIDGRSNSSTLPGLVPIAAERVFFNISMRIIGETNPVTSLLVNIGFGSSLSSGLRVSGSDAERTAFNISLVAKQGANVTVSGVTVAAASTSDTLRIGQQYTGVYRANDGLERINLLLAKSLEAGSNTATVAATDRSRTSSLFVRGAAFTQEDQPLLDLRSLLINKTMYSDDGSFRSDTTIAQDGLSRYLQKTLTDKSGDLDPFGNINTLDSHGILRMTSYTDIDYFTDDYVGESRSFT